VGSGITPPPNNDKNGIIVPFSITPGFKKSTEFKREITASFAGSIQDSEGAAQTKNFDTGFN